MQKQWDQQQAMWWMIRTAGEIGFDGLVKEAMALMQWLHISMMNEELFRNTLDQQLWWDKEAIDKAVQEVMRDVTEATADLPGQLPG